MDFEGQIPYLKGTVSWEAGGVLEKEYRASVNLGPDGSAAR